MLITTDNVDRNKEWFYGYRENDPLGGHDPSSSSKAAAELAIASWRASFCGSQPHQTPHLRVARAGNVIGCGDWAADRIVPDAMLALERGERIGDRNTTATLPWQHVLKPLSSYLCLAERLSAAVSIADAFNFGSQLEANHSVRELVEGALRQWPGTWSTRSMQRPPMRPACSTCLADLVSLAATPTR